MTTIYSFALVTVGFVCLPELYSTPKDEQVVFVPPCVPSFTPSLACLRPTAIFLTVPRHTAVTGRDQRCALVVFLM